MGPSPWPNLFPLGPLCPPHEGPSHACADAGPAYSSSALGFCKKLLPDHQVGSLQSNPLLPREEEPWGKLWKLTHGHLGWEFHSPRYPIVV